MNWEAVSALSKTSRPSSAGRLSTSTRRKTATVSPLRLRFRELRVTLFEREETIRRMLGFA